MTKQTSLTNVNSQHDVDPEVLHCIFLFFHTLMTVGECQYSVKMFNAVLCFDLEIKFGSS